MNAISKLLASFAMWPAAAAPVRPIAQTRHHEPRLYRPTGTADPLDEHLLRSHGLQWVAIIMCAVLTSCGGGSTSSTPSSSVPISLSIQPSAVALTPGQSQTFVATVTGLTNSALTWSVAEGASGGTVGSTGIYHAPTSFGSYTVIATSQADSSRVAKAHILVTPPLAVTPGAAIVGPGRSITFTAVVTGLGDSHVAWHVAEAAGGTVTAAGVYSAPATLGTYHVVATSVDDASRTLAVPVSVVASGFFTPTGSMRSNAPAGVTTTLLTSRKVLVVGSDAELYDASTGSFSLTRNMAALPYWHTATALHNGTVLLTGGAGGYAELYDPVADTFTATGSMLNVNNHNAHTATLLSDGRVLIAGGYKNPDGTYALGTAEIYDPATRAFTATGNMIIRRSSHTATLLADGTVLIAGGFNTDGGPIARAELYDPAKGTFAPTGGMTTSRGAHSATLLQDGKLLVAGGFGVLTAEVYDPALRAFSPTGSMGLGRAENSATLLPNGKVLVVGGSNSSTSELYDPGTGTFTPSGTMQVGRTAPAATVLHGDTVLVVGGDLFASAELYQ